MFSRRHTHTHTAREGVVCCGEVLGFCTIYIIQNPRKQPRRNLSIRRRWGMRHKRSTKLGATKWRGCGGRRRTPCGIFYFCQQLARSNNQHHTSLPNKTHPHLRYHSSTPHSCTQKNVSRVLNFDDDVETRDIPSYLCTEKRIYGFFLMYMSSFLLLS